MTQNSIFSRDESGVEVQTVRVSQPCDGYACLDSGNVPLAMSYTPMQKYEDVYDVQTALCRGTLFKKLDLPFTGKRGDIRD